MHSLRTKRSRGEERLWTPGLSVSLMLAASYMTNYQIHLIRAWDVHAGLGIYPKQCAMIYWLVNDTVTIDSEWQWK